MSYPFTTVCPGSANKLINEVQVAQSPAEGKPIFNGKYKALWDTGATCSVITQKIVDDLKLDIVSYGPVASVNSVETAQFYYVDILLPNNVAVRSLLVPLGKPSGCDLLIGMDIIGKGDFAVSNHSGRTVFTYRIPSLMTFDFVNNTYLTPFKKEQPDIGRNAPCPCGSGKKYKNCHGKSQ